MTERRSGGRLQPGSRLLMRAAGIAILICPAVAFAEGGQVEALAPSHTAADFDGDGVLDRAFGYPRASGDVGGVVLVMSDGTVRSLDRDTPGVASIATPLDYFGDSVAAGDIDGDGFDDLIVGVPGDSGFLGNGGSVHVFYGSASGLSVVGDQVLHADSFGLAAESSSRRSFGETLAVGDFDCDGFADVGVGIPLAIGSDPSGAEGAVTVLFGSPTGVTTVRDAYVPGGLVTSGGDRRDFLFGGALASGRFLGEECDALAVGAPGRTGDLGFVALLARFDRDAGLASMVETLVSAGLEGDAYERFGAFFGAALWPRAGQGGFDDLVIAAPGVLCESATGALHRLEGTESGVVSSGDLVSMADEFMCIGWTSSEIRSGATAYESCVSAEGGECIVGFIDGLVGSGMSQGAAEETACQVAAQVASDACDAETMIDTGTCTYAASELGSSPSKCLFSGDVMAHGY